MAVDILKTVFDPKKTLVKLEKRGVIADPQLKFEFDMPTAKNRLTETAL